LNGVRKQIRTTHRSFYVRAQHRLIGFRNDDSLSLQFVHHLRDALSS
jgi:hypothetical protein